MRECYAGNPAFRRRFALEVASAQRIHGLFAVQVVHSGVDAPASWLAAAGVPGLSLRQVVRRRCPLPVRAVPLLGAGTAEILEGIRRAGAVRRELKPAGALGVEGGRKGRSCGYRCLVPGARRL
ncbi:hypothetical protein ACWEJZ_25100 [Streptomyces bacillaris]